MQDFGLVSRVSWTPASPSEDQANFDKVVFLVPGDDEAYNSEAVSAYQAQLADENYATAVVSHITEHDALLASPGSIIVHIPNTPSTKDGIYEAVHKSSRVLKMEIPDIFGGLFEVDQPSFPTSAIKSAHGHDIVRVCDGTAHSASLEPLSDQSNNESIQSRLQLGPENTYLVTGGTRGMGLEIATWLTERGARNLILLSRQGMPVVEKGSKPDAGAEKFLSQKSALEAKGVTVHVLAIDMGKPEAGPQLRDAIARLGLPPVKGVVHAAGLAAYHTLDRCTPAGMAEVLAPKVQGGLTLDALFLPRTLDFFALMSSMGQLVGFEGQLSYAPANAFLDGLAARRRRQGDNCTAILWSTWRGVGMAAQSKSATRMIDRGMRDRGFAAISAEEAFAAWDRIAGLGTDHAVVVRALEATTDGSRPHPMLKHIMPSELALRGERGTQDSAQWKQTAIEYPDDAVAVVGMACQTAAGETAEDLWQVLLEGKSMVRKLPLDRFPEMAGKPPMSANLMSNIENFDHQFFKKTRREAAALDPHQRLLLQTTYHALESAGWVGGDKQEPETHKTPGPTTSTGCFIGMNAPDWPLNLASHPASPYTGTGMLRSFAAGRLSHHFGWTGPSQTVDTACSSAMVAVHQACRALRLGECTRAVAGGANLLTNTALSEALRAGGFLSATDGPCKPFDARGDGYCRGEAVGVVVLKPLSAARRDGDDVLGVLLATGNNQNVNSTSITNPVLESQAALYRDVLGRAGVRPQDISYVEAHGTGTKAGDPVEMGGIRQVLGGKDRASTLHIGAVKANVGHAEAAAGVVSLIKVLLMMRYGKITPQAQFQSLNPNIQPLENDGLAIATSLKGWNDGMRLALVNSFGASGNNAAAIIAPPPLKETEPAVSSANSASTSASFPIIITASSTTSLSSYCEKLKSRIEDPSRQHQQLFCTTAKTLGELQAQLSSPEKLTSAAQRPRPVVLLFSGQNGNTVPPARPLYDSSALFQKHLHQCDEALQSLGFPSLFPAVLEGFQGDSDIVLRHAAMFAIQYSSGMSWLDSGLQPQAVCGHSFGEWAAATVSGVMTLDAGMRLVTGEWIILIAKAKKAIRRASIIQKLWGDDTGSMIAIEAELVKKDITPELHLEPFLKQHSKTKISVACYNGPNHYVAAGPTPDIELLEAYMKDRKSSGEAMRFKVLKGMHAYHCAMADPIVEESGKLSSTIPFQEPTFPFESCNPDTWTGPASNVIASNTRGPVYFTQTIARIVDRLGPSTFLEAGFGGPIVAMARNALSQSQSQHTFVAIDGKKPAQSLADATATLWKNGQPNVQFWPFHKSQRGSYASVVLPPYQFEKNRHWLNYTADKGEALASLGQCPHCLKRASDVPYIVQDKSSSRTDAETSPALPGAHRGHVVVGTPICPASMYMELATLAVTSLKPTAMSSEITVNSLAIKAPLSLDTQRAISLAVTKRSEVAWEFEVSSTKGSERLTSHATGTVNLGGHSSSILNDDQSDDWDKWARIGRLLEKDTDTDALRGAMVYKVFSAMAQYSPVYKGLKHLVGKGAEAAGDISMPALDLDPAARAPNDSIADTVVVDNFLQVPGAFVHSLRRGTAGEEDEQDGGMVYTKAIAESSNKVTLNMFALDKVTQKTVWSAKGLQFSKVPRSSLAKVLAGANPDKELGRLQVVVPPTTAPSRLPIQEKTESRLQVRSVPSSTPVQAVTASESKPDLVISGVQEILAKSLDVPMEEITKQATLEDLGADSLVSPEILSSISSKFGIDITSDEFASATNVALLCALVSSTIGGPGNDSEEGQEPEMATPAVHIDTATVWQDAVFKSLGDSLDVPIEEIQMDSKLEDLGVDSLISGEIITRLNEALNVDITSSELASATDVASLCQLIAESLDGGSSATPQSQSTNEKPSATKRTSPSKATSMLLHRGSASAAKTRNLFLVPDGFGSGAVFGPLAPLLARVTDVSVYALNSPYLTRDNQPADLDLDLLPTLEQLAAAYVAELRRRQPEGPYLLGGYSVGGLVAYEMARQLLEDGCAVEKVFLIDTVCPTLATSLPDTLVDFFESIGSHLGVANEDEVRAKNGGRLLTSRHFTLARRQLSRYKVKSGLPGGQKKRPQFVLFSAREGLDKQSAIARPTLSVEGERKMAEWFLDDRSDSSGALGWEEFLGSPVRVERADGNHFSMMTPQMVSSWGSKLAELLE
ncbi:hypothetical protein PG997_005719 [Apiospora hydei]|uniref:Polyketide synthase n=1 Tax=Apiospora hydei TaxID=1337664 RepID=A0ABR1WLR0_9PEZI